MKKTSNITQKAIIGSTASLAIILGIITPIIYEATGFAISLTCITVGAIIGYAVGKMNDHPDEGAAIGAAIGSIAGIVLSSIIHKKHNEEGVDNNDYEKAFDCIGKEAVKNGTNIFDCVQGNPIGCISLVKAPLSVVDCMGEGAEGSIDAA